MSGTRERVCFGGCNGGEPGPTKAVSRGDGVILVVHDHHEDVEGDGLPWTAIAFHAPFCPFCGGRLTKSKDWRSVSITPLIARVETAEGRAR